LGYGDERTTECDHARESNDEGGDIAVGNPVALEEADEDTDGERCADCGNCAPAILYLENCGNRTGEPGNTSDREVDVPGNNDQDHTDGKDRDIARLHEEVGKVPRAEENPPSQNIEDNPDSDEGKKHGILLKVVANLVLQDSAKARFWC